MKPRHRSDDVASAIVHGLRGSGCKVMPLESPEAGHPDYLVGWVGSLTLLELKSPGGTLSESQKSQREDWERHGVRVYVVKTLREALDAVGITGPRAEENRRALRSLVSDRARTKAVRGKLRPNVTPAVSYAQGVDPIDGTRLADMHAGQDRSGIDGT